MKNKVSFFIFLIEFWIDLSLENTLFLEIGRHTFASEKLYLQLCALHGLFFNVFAQQTDKAAFRKLWDFVKVIPMVHLCGNVCFYPSDFIIKNCGIMIRTIGNPDTSMYRNGLMKFLDENLAERVKELYMEASVWMVRMESNLGNRLQPKDSVKSRIGLIKYVNLSQFFFAFIVILYLVIDDSSVVHVFQSIN